MKNGFIRVGAATPRLRVADSVYNSNELVRLTLEADANGVRVLVFPELSLKTGELSEKISRGKQTTRTVELFPFTFSEGETVFVADTPGFSSFDTDMMEIILKENLQFAFADFGPYMGKCQFHDCTHRKEPGCAVSAAVASGEIEPTRYDSYLRLYEKSSQIKQWELK